MANIPSMYTYRRLYTHLSTSVYNYVRQHIANHIDARTLIDMWHAFHVFSREVVICEIVANFSTQKPGTLDLLLKKGDCHLAGQNHLP